MKDAMFADNKFLREFCAKAMAILAYLKNLLLTSLKKRISKELWTSKRQNAGYLVI